MRVLRLVLGTLGIFGVAVLGFVTPSYAIDHTLSEDSVDCTGSGCEIRWEDYTKYSPARNHANDTWNAVGPVQIGPDDAGSYTDLEWRDYSNCSSTAYDAYWDASAGADVIKFNTCKMDNYSVDDRQAIAAHELGHALRIRDHPNDRSTSAYWRERAIMYFNPKACAFKTPREHDKNDYNLTW